MNLNEKKICIAGTEGFGRETLTCLMDSFINSSINIEEAVVFMERDNYSGPSTIMGIPVIKDSDFDVNKYQVVVAIGDPKIRKKIVERLPQETEYKTIIHPTAVISRWVEIGEGSIITAGVILTCNIRIGSHAHLNLNTTIGHDCSIGDFFTTAPAANVSGNCTFEEGVYLGTSSSVKQGVSICKNVTIGMGGIVVKSITEEGVYIGSPVKKLIK